MNIFPILHLTKCYYLATIALTKYYFLSDPRYNRKLWDFVVYLCSRCFEFIDWHPRHPQVFQLGFQTSLLPWGCQFQRNMSPRNTLRRVHPMTRGVASSVWHRGKSRCIHPLVCCLVLTERLLLHHVCCLES